MLSQSMAPPPISKCELISWEAEPKRRLQKRWKTEADRLSYSSKLLEALRQVRLQSLETASASAPAPSRVVRDAADRILAKAARGRTRWSRAILSRQPPPRLMRVGRKKTQALTGRSLLRERRLPGLQKRVRALGRLVPGCRKASFHVLVEEATDYIAALEMQVLAMRSLADLLSAAPQNQIGSSSAASS